MTTLDLSADYYCWFGSSPQVLSLGILSSVAIGLSPECFLRSLGLEMLDESL